VTLHEVLEAVEASNLNSSGGVFMEKGQEYLIAGLVEYTGRGYP
jgi:Cu/Ag efflux pump CusA